ncbi:hypothetical protein F4678DRAFT_421239 [Xylaria arbuscula]|nr:hypothetical protein F4678DRAFT_421239 [Xylaria arbuscula]
MHHGANLSAPTVSRAALYTSRAMVHDSLMPRLPILLSCCGAGWSLPSTMASTGYFGLFYVLGSQLDLDIDILFFRLLFLLLFSSAWQKLSHAACFSPALHKSSQLDREVSS